MDWSLVFEVGAKALLIVAALVVLRYLIQAVGKGVKIEEAPDERLQQLETRITALEDQVRALQTEAKTP